MQVTELIADLVVLKPSYTLREVARLFLKYHIDSAPVVDENNHIIGIVSKVHFYQAIDQDYDLNLLVADILARDTKTIRHNLHMEDNNEDFRQILLNNDDMVHRPEVISRFSNQVKDVSVELNTVLESVYNGIMSIDQNYRIRTFNRAAERIFGIPKEKVINKLYHEIFPQGPLAEIIKSGSTETAQKVKYQDKTLLANRTPIIVGGQVVGAVAVIQDISDFESISDELQIVKQSQENMEAIIAASLDSVFVVDADAKVVSVNEAYTRITGIKAEDILGKSMHELIDKGFYDRAVSLMVLEGKRTATYTEQTPTGKTALFIGTPIFNNQGEIVNVLVNIYDITELEAVSNELQKVKQLKEELDALIDASFDGIFITDNKGHVLTVNEAYMRITGFRAEEIEGHNMYDLIESGYYDQSAAIAVIEKGELVTLTQRVKTGKTLLSTGNPIYDKNGQVSRVLINCRDLTELNKLKQEVEQVSRLNKHYQEELKRFRLDGCEGYVAQAQKSKKLMELVTRIGQVDSIVLIQGESGVGKEIVAQELHNNSLRADKPYIKVNCAAIPESLLESELFGYEAGAFTGALKKGKTGFFELADQGTLFLDEIGEFPLNLQASLLRVLQEGEFTRVGGTSPIKVDVRVIAATNRNLAAMVDKNQFREDLYYRLNVIPLYVPPLRERKEEIPELIDFFVDSFNKKYNLNKKITPKLIKRMVEYNWPGNVRELKNYIERAIVTSAEALISEVEIPPTLVGKTHLGELNIDLNNNITLKEAVENFEKSLLSKYIAHHKSTRKTAQALGVSRTTIWRKAHQYGIKLEEN
ncbi:MAG TPA: sigma 54-interacting transcriptional regulator [Syntrophomonadaceae bacterium]|nr:sigma 54-interacting transcriptional regulator [Syntrophomonadaceae bacterium]